VQTATVIATKYWASHLGCSIEEIFSQPLRILTHAADLADYDGVFALFRGSAAVVSLPPQRQTPLRHLLDGYTDAISPQLLATKFAPVAERVIGPAFLGYAAKVTAPAHAIRELGPVDAAAVQSLEQACPPEEWEHGGSAGAQPASGIFADDRLAACASYEGWGGLIAHISVVTHPAYRNRGYGRSTVAHVARRALAAGLLPQYRTLETNGPSLRIARSLGFQSFARSLAVRLQPAH
jgi:GNAT superfamily N-acetyltransferase